MPEIQGDIEGRAGAAVDLLKQFPHALQRPRRLMRRIHLLDADIAHAGLLGIARQLRQRIVHFVQLRRVQGVVLQQRFVKTVGEEAKARVQSPRGVHLRLHPRIPEAFGDAPVVMRKAAGGIGPVAGIDVSHHAARLCALALDILDPIPRKFRAHVQRIAFRVGAGLDPGQPEFADDMHPFPRLRPTL